VRSEVLSSSGKMMAERDEAGRNQATPY